MRELSLSERVREGRREADREDALLLALLPTVRNKQDLLHWCSRSEPEANAGQMSITALTRRGPRSWLVQVTCRVEHSQLQVWPINKWLM